MLPLPLGEKGVPPIGYDRRGHRAGLGTVGTALVPPWYHPVWVSVRTIGTAGSPDGPVGDRKSARMGGRKGPSIRMDRPSIHTDGLTRMVPLQVPRYP